MYMYHVNAHVHVYVVHTMYMYHVTTPQTSQYPGTEPDLTGSSHHPPSLPPPPFYHPRH